MQSGVRIQKVLSENGIMSRRKADAAIAQGRITVNGRPASLGQRINTRNDIVAIDHTRVDLSTKRPTKVYLMLNKPRGYVSTTNDEKGRKTVLDLLSGVEQRVYPIGRLDLTSEGLLLLTNDGDFANQVIHPSSQIAKTYRVTVTGDISELTLINLSVGVVLDDGYKSAPATIHVLEEYPDRTVLQFTIYEGKNRLIRRMCEACKLNVIRLKRLSIGPIKLGMLKPGSYRELKPSELIAIRGAIKKGSNQSEERKKRGD